MKETIPVFILGSGRCGTFQMVKMLETLPNIEAHHEYLFENVLKPAVLFRMGATDKTQILELLRETHLPAIHYSSKPIWLDSSNALPWIVEPLVELFPTAKFVHLVRDGRKVVSSFFNKFKEVIYDDACVEILTHWFEQPSKLAAPPPEKKYWRPIPVQNEPYFHEFKEFSRFQRLCYYWRDCNLRIRETLAVVPSERRLTVRLEDVVSSRETLAAFLAIVGVPYDDKFLEFLKRPLNVAIPRNFMLTKQERQEFSDIADETMHLFGYDDQEEYNVVY